MVTVDSKALLAIENSDKDPNGTQAGRFCLACEWSNTSHEQHAASIRRKLNRFKDGMKAVLKACPRGTVLNLVYQILYLMWTIGQGKGSYLALRPTRCLMFGFVPLHGSICPQCIANISTKVIFR